MLLRLLLLFTIVPIVELAILIPLGGWIGIWPTVALVVVTGVLGAVLGKRQGIAAWRRIQQELRQGQIPSGSLLDGLAVLIAGAFLVTPGVLTDIAGMSLLVPALRAPLKRYLKNRFKNAVEAGTVNFISVDRSSGGSPFGQSPFGGQNPFGSQSPGGSADDEEVIDVTPGPSDAQSSEESADEEREHHQLP